MTSMPGAVMCAPMRYTNSARSVKPILDFSSGVLNRFEIAAAAFPCAMLLLDAASSRDNLLPDRCAHLDAAHRDRAGELAVGEQLRWPLPRADEPHLGERLRRDFRSLRQTVQVLQPDDLVLDAERVRE